jgi:hypothetical protein
MSPTDIKFSTIAETKIHYDRDRTQDYGTIGRPVQLFTERNFHDDLEVCFQDLWGICPLGKANIITTAGTFVPESEGFHSVGQAFDLDGLFWDDREFVTYDDGFRGGDKKFYFGVNAVLHKHFGVVLNYSYNALHQDHFHIDDSLPVGFATNARSKVTFLQGALVHIMKISIGTGSEPTEDDIDGDYGPNTNRGVMAALAELNINGSLNSKTVWLQFLDALARRAFGKSSIAKKNISITSPTENQRLLIADTVVFSGTADPDVVSVKLLAENRFDLGAKIPVKSGKWKSSYTFIQGGARKIIVKGFDKNDNQIASTEVNILLLSGSGGNGYKPPTLSIARLGTIPSLLDGATQVMETFLGGKILFRLLSGQLYVDADMDIDADGSPNYQKLDPQYGQRDTSLRYSDGSSVDAEKVPYFVLPGNFFQQQGIRLGDIAAVVYKGRVEFAILADIGPTTKIGEGSIALSRSLGNEPVINGTVQNGIDEDVVYIVFPGSGNGTPQTVDAVRVKGRKLFSDLGGIV